MAEAVDGAWIEGWGWWQARLALLLALPVLLTGVYGTNYVFLAAHTPYKVSSYVAAESVLRAVQQLWKLLCGAVPHSKSHLLPTYAGRPICSHRKLCSYCLSGREV
ncbi:hypothetical protein O0L34_g5717 [Tuta absoluta]|nr:hypothetical protein O0L34_g5717 [Tuta absoluta]